VILEHAWVTCYNLLIITLDAAAGTLFNDEEKIESGQGNKGLIIPLLMQNKPPVKFEKDKLNDIPLRPDQSTMDDYDEMPVGHFGSAILKGMGWAPGQSIGLNKKGLTDLVEFIPHPGGLGMGATPRPMKSNKNKIKKPGEINVKRPKPYKDKDGKIKHVKKIDEVIPEQIPEGFHVGNQAVVTDGPHKGLYGKITSLDDESVTLKLRINGQVSECTHVNSIYSITTIEYHVLNKL
jgi:G patch domain/KOW motif-containing protein